MTDENPIPCCTISGQQLGFATFRGTVEEVQIWTETQVWSEGGGFVPSRHDGYFTPPIVRSRSILHQRVRLSWEDGGSASIDLPGGVKLSAGDAVAFVSVENCFTKTWQWAGVVNLTLGNWCPIGDIGLIAKVQTPTFLDQVGFVYVNLTRGNPVTGLGLVLVGGAALGIALAASINHSIDGFVDRFGSAFALAGIVGVAIPVFVGDARIRERARRERARYDEFRRGHLQELLDSGLEKPARNRATSFS